MLIRSQSYSLIKILVTVSLNPAGLRPAPLVCSQNFFSLDLSCYQIKELLQLDFLPVFHKFSGFFFSFIAYIGMNNNVNSWYYCLSIARIKQHEKICLFPGSECYFLLHIKALWQETSGMLPLQKHLLEQFWAYWASFFPVPLKKNWCPLRPRSFPKMYNKQPLAEALW